MNRRDFITKSALTVAGSGVLGAKAFANGAPIAKDAPFNLNYAPHFGMFKNSAGDDLVDQVKFMYERGFRSMEDNGMMGRSVADQERIGKEMARLGMKMGVFVVSYLDGPQTATFVTGKQEWQDKFLQACRDAVEVAKRVNAKWMTVVPGNFERRLPMGIQTANVIELLKRASDIFEPHGLTMVLEPLSDTPDLFLRYSDQTYMICRAVDSPACKILFDMWHMQRNEGRLMYNMDMVWDEIGYFQIGDEPGRKEPTTGEMNYKNLFKHIYDKSKANGQEFILGMEHGNFFSGKEGEEKLIASYRQVDDFM
ncbi:TIM barrel protein [Marinilongibacter aquaticus]|uniref:hydroxypyruvate isomerase family protein n=1 Tax=Marinilongibacter aquaticus TaxID=2975157 RepID=UPI0021BDD861|nr:TIM barrel protein [Marinilongibacter aquaticus]UBM61011.1 TIM barrel protein [Marinilongibacter aquaticus]